jgi:hypothetical protein
MVDSTIFPDILQMSVTSSRQQLCLLFTCQLGIFAHMNFYLNQCRMIFVYISNCKYNVVVVAAAAECLLFVLISKSNVLKQVLFNLFQQTNVMRLKPE